jgi:hypothetical protein
MVSQLSSCELWRSHTALLFISPVFLGRDLCVCWDGHLLQFYLIDFLVTTLVLRAQLQDR